MVRETLVMVDEIRCALEIREDESRQSPGRLTGVLLRYETRAGDRPELFVRGALRWAEKGILVREQHNRQAPIVRAVPFLDGDDVRIDAPLPNTTRGRDAATNIREGVLTGLSVEFKSLLEGRRGMLREIKSAMLGGAGLVDDPSYTDSLVEVRARSEAEEREALERLLWL